MSEHDDDFPADLVTLGRAATILGVNPKLVYRWIDEGRVRAWKIGGRLRLSDAEVRGMVKPRQPRQPPPKVVKYGQPTKREREQTRRDLAKLGITY